MRLPPNYLPSFEDLCYHSGTFQSFTLSGTGRNRKYGIRRGVLTNLGDLELSEWRRLMLDLIQRSGEMVLFEQLKHWVKDNTYVKQTPQELEDYALRLHSHRIFENPNWVGYEAFNRIYRPSTTEP